MQCLEKFTHTTHKLHIMFELPRFFELIQTKFPDVTISPGWTVLYLPPFPNVTYTQSMVEKMFNTVKHLSQKITFPVLAVMAKNGWPHLSWLLRQSSRYFIRVLGKRFMRWRQSTGWRYFSVFNVRVRNESLEIRSRSSDRIVLFYHTKNSNSHFKTLHGPDSVWPCGKVRKTPLSMTCSSFEITVTLNVSTTTSTSRSCPSLRKLQVGTIENSPPPLTLLYINVYF